MLLEWHNDRAIIAEVAGRTNVKAERWGMWWRLKFARADVQLKAGFVERRGTDAVNTDYIRTIFDYNLWAHGQVWDCIMQVSEEQFVQDFDYSIGSIRNHIVHVMSVDQRWLARVAGAALPERLNAADFTTRAAARARWNEIEANSRAVVYSLTDGDLDHVLTYDMSHRGGTKRDAVWQIIAHVVNHGTDHRAQILSLLHRLGAPTVEQDLMFYLWDSV